MALIKCGTVLLAVAMAAPAALTAQTVTTTTGKLQGVRRENVDTFLGIPYAKAPIGNLRWRSPQPIAWSGTRDATHPGAACPQRHAEAGYKAWTSEYHNQTPMSEDCLFLNVWSPGRSPAGKKAPVLVWIHGGGFVGGSGTVPIYDGANLARRGVVVVTINYRLGVFGFLAQPELTREAGTSGNYAIQDMIASLKWVKANIAAFGGDPAQITIAGQSAGAASVQILLASPKAKGLFARAIVQSGFGLGDAGQSLRDAEQQGSKFMTAAGAASIDALRKVGWEEVAQLAGVNGAPAANGFRFGPIVDGRYIPRPASDLRPGEFSDTPVLAGLVADEGSMLTPNYGVATPATLRTRIETTFGDLAPQASRFYEAGDDAQAGEQAKALARDQGVASAVLWAANHQRVSSKPVYLYLFDHIEPGTDPQKYGVFHSSELPYVFDTLGASPGRPFGPVDHALATTMSTYWLNFVRTGNPNGGGLPTWPVANGRTPTIMRFGTSATAQPALPPAKLDVYRSTAAKGRPLGML